MDIIIDITKTDLKHNTHPLIVEFTNIIKDGIPNDVLLITGNNMECFQKYTNDINQLYVHKDFIKILYYNNNSDIQTILINTKNISSIELVDVV